MIDTLYILDKFLNILQQRVLFISFPRGYGGNTLSRIIAASPEIYWKGNPIEYPDKGYSIVVDDPSAPHFASDLEQELCCTHTSEDLMYPDKNRIQLFMLYAKLAKEKIIIVRSHNRDTYKLFKKSYTVYLYGKEPDFRFFDSTDMYKKPKQFPNVINVDVNEIFSKDYDTFETAYLDICTKLDITPQINRVRAFILLWLERQERYKKL